MAEDDYLVRNSSTMRRFLLLLLICIASQKAFAVDDSTVAAAPVQLSFVSPHHYLQADEYTPDKARRRTPLSQLSEQQYANRLMTRGGILLVAAGSLLFISEKASRNSGTTGNGSPTIAGVAAGTALCAGMYGLFLLVSGAYYDGQLHGSRTVNWTP